jgi:hypothetical protein
MRYGWIVVLLLAGCGTTRTTDSKRAGTEMLLVSQAIDRAVDPIDFSPLAGRTVYFEDKFLEGGGDEAYLISTLREKLLTAGALLKDKKADAQIVVEARSGGIGTDHSSVMIGTPAITLPSITAVPVTSIPEIALMKKSDQRGVAKVAVFAYDRGTGRVLWASGIQSAGSQLKDTWVFGAGPYSRGSIRTEAELAGEPLPKIPIPTMPSMPTIPGVSTVNTDPATVPAGGVADGKK